MVRLLHLRQRDGEALHDALKARMADLPAALLRSITWDQGTEMARHRTITRSLGAPVYFADSHSPWQQGSNENHQRAAAGLLPQGHRPERPLPAAPAGRRERTQQPAPAHPQRPGASRTVRRPASLRESASVATLTRTCHAAPWSVFSFRRVRHEALLIQVEVRDLHRSACRSR
jgi:hypothetical protein